MKLNRIAFLIILMLCISIILSGCGTPEGFDSDLWRDSVKVVKIIKKAYDKDDNLSVRDENFIDDYFEKYEGRIYDNPKEYELIKDLKKLYYEYGVYISSLNDDFDKFLKIIKHDIDDIFIKLKNDYKNLI